MLFEPASENEIIVAIIFGTVLLFIFIAFCITYLLIYRRKRSAHRQEIDHARKEFQRQLLQSQIEVQEYTYNALSRELHDNVGQLLNTSLLLLGLTERGLPEPPDTLKTAYATIADAVNELRSLSRSLSREWLEQFSFTANLAAEIQRINNFSRLVETNIGANSPFPLKSEEQIILFRIVQEGIQNAIKHAKPSRINISVTDNDRQLFISISDNGPGFDPEMAFGGIGLLNMKHRTSILGGTISWLSAPGVGTAVNIIIPFN